MVSDMSIPATYQAQYGDKTVFLIHIVVDEATGSPYLLGHGEKRTF
jgi:hypothetical protein